MSSIELLSHQENHVKKIWKLLTKNRVFSFVDTSQTGLGKTITSLYLAKELQTKYNTKVMIVAPSETSLENDDGWLEHSKEYGINVEIATTYSQLKSNKGKKWVIQDKEDKKNWVATKEFSELCEKGLFIIFDEFHHTKNESITHFACAALVRAAKRYRKYCRVALLSHTPGDKKEHYPQILRMTGIISAKKMFKHIAFTSNFDTENYGLGELAKTCSKLNPKHQAEIYGMMEQMSKNKSFIISKELYDCYIRHLITFAMPVPDKKKTTMLNAFLETDEQSLRLLEKGISILSNAVNWNSDNGEVGDAATWNIANVGNSLKLIERGKLFMMARYVINEVKKNPKKKFIISCGARGIEHHDILSKIIYKKTVREDYQDMIDEIKKKTKIPRDVLNLIFDKVKEKVKPKVLNGKTDKADRIRIIREFQADNSKTWCLIISPGIGSESISLHDKHGNRPRDMLIVPSYYLSRTIQSAGRIDRVGMKSEAKVMMVYSKEAEVETNILNSMIKKSKTARDLIAKGQKVTFPGEYPFYIEGKKDHELEYRLKELKNL